MRLIKLFGVLAATIVAYLVMLHFKVPFGIALIIAMGMMWYGVKYVRQQHPESEYNPQESANCIDYNADETTATGLPNEEADIEESACSDIEEVARSNEE